METEPIAMLFVFVFLVAGHNIFPDCGWNYLFGPSFLGNLSTVTLMVHAVHSSHPDICHLGGLPYSTSQFGYTVPMFSIISVWRICRMFMHDVFIAQDVHKPFALFILAVVDAFFDYLLDHGKESQCALYKYQQA